MPPEGNSKRFETTTKRFETDLEQNRKPMRRSKTRDFPKTKKSPTERRNARWGGFENERISDPISTSNEKEASNFEVNVERCELSAVRVSP